MSYSYIEDSSLSSLEDALADETTIARNKLNSNSSSDEITSPKPKRKCSSRILTEDHDLTAFSVKCKSTPSRDEKSHKFRVKSKSTPSRSRHAISKNHIVKRNMWANLHTSSPNSYIYRKSEPKSQTTLLDNTNSTITGTSPEKLGNTADYSLDDTFIQDSSEDDLEKLEKEVLAKYAEKNADPTIIDTEERHENVPKSTRPYSQTSDKIDDSPTPPENKLIYSNRDTTAFQFYQKPPQKIKPLKGGLAEKFERHLNELKSNTNFWINERMNFTRQAGKIFKVKTIENIYGRRVLSYENVNTGIMYYIFLDAADKMTQKVEVGQRCEYEEDKRLRKQMNLTKNKKINLDFDIIPDESASCKCNVLLGLHKINICKS